MTDGRFLLTDEPDEELLQIKLDHLKAPEGSVSRKFHLFRIGVVQRRGKAPFGFGQDVCNQAALRLPDAQGFGAEKIHGGTVTGEGDHHEIRRDFPV